MEDREGTRAEGVSAPHVYGSITSREAAIRIEPATATLKAAVLQFIRGRGEIGATDEEMQTGIPMSASTQRPRRVELLRATLIRDSGRTRSTKSGRAAVVWEVAP